jgi:hypothetical protein
MIKIKSEVKVTKPSEYNERFLDEIALVVDKDWNPFGKDKYKLIFKNPDMQIYNSIGIHKFTKDEIEVI